MNSSLSGGNRTLNPTRRSFNSKDILSGIVTSVILNDNSTGFSDAKDGYNSMGTINFEAIDNDNPSTPKDNLKAKPLFPYITCYPLVGEVVLIIKSLSQNPVNTNDGTQVYYYLPNVNLFNTPSYNPSNFTNEELVLRDPVRTNSKSVILPITPKSADAGSYEPTPSGNSTFIDNGKVRQTKIFTGDIVFQGRFGSNLRFSSTRPGSGNSWSNPAPGTTNGDPITILNNGIHDGGPASFVPFSENPTDDKSSIYLTSTQVLPINRPEINFNSSTESPESLLSYSNPQILINSDRLVLAAKKDSIIIGAGKNINLSGKNIGIDARNEFSVSSNNIRLGNVNADQPVMLGNKTNDLLIKALTSINELIETLEDSKIFPGGQPAPNEPVIMQAISTQNRINEVISVLTGESHLSKTTFTT
tara:strand:- start:7983 stop:9233 length:1251 start_codon:yes stop_codon:yes gene_type:complete